MDGTEPPCKKIGNAHGLFVVAIKKVTPTGNMTVGHPARVISLVCLVFYSLRWNYAVCSEWGKTIFVQFASGGFRSSVYFDLCGIHQEEGEKAKKLIDLAL